MKKQEIVYKNKERGAITLFVLLACLFFVFVIMGVYVGNLNKIQVQEQEIEQIRENYGKELKNVEEIYNELSKGMRVSLSQSPEAGTWTQEVTLTGKAEVREEGTTIVKYAFSKDVTDESALTWETVDSETKIEKTTNITENGKYYFWAQDSEGNIKKSTELEISNIDKNAPTAGTIIAKTENKDGEDYTLDTWTDKSIYIEKVNGTDEESGHKQTTITILKNGLPVEEWTNIEGPVTIEESGTYTITVTTEDNAGNTATSESYIVKIDKVVPVLTLKHNDATGEEYESGTWTKDDLYGEITIDDATGKTVDRYQYSENGITWDDISAEQVIKAIDYTTTFPMGEGKPEWISGPTNNNVTYYFEVQEDGTLKPNNSGKNSSVANSYFEIDLTDYPDAELEITINATISSESNYDFGYATITEDSTDPTFSKSNTYYIKVSGATTTADHTTTITGGKKYYLHIAYSKDSSSSKNQDTFIINSITLKSEALERGINFADYIKTENKVSFKLNEDIENDIYIRAVYTEENDYSKYGDKISIKIDKKAPLMENSNVSIISKEEAKADIIVTEKESGLKGYYISTEETVPTEENEWIEQTLKEFTIEGLLTNTTYYLWLIDNVGNISERQEINIDGINYEVDGTIYTVTLSEAIESASDGSTIKLLNDYTDTSTAAINKNITFDVQEFTLIREKEITISSGKTVEITGAGKITTGTNGVYTISNYGILTISDSITIENGSTSANHAPIYNSLQIININDDVKVIGYYKGIYNYSGTTNVNGGYVEATYENSSAYGIYNYRSSSKVYINAGEIKGYYGIMNSDASVTIEMTGGKVVGTGAYGIYANGITNIYGGRIEGKTYGVYGYSTDKVTIGREDDELNRVNPAIFGETYGVYMYNETYSFNFYNGKIISNTEETAYRGIANLRENHMTYTYIDYEIEQKYCTILTPIVENIIMEAVPIEYTNGNVTVKITYPYAEGIICQYSENGIEWKDAEQYIQEVIVSENKTIYARTMDESEIITDENQIVVNNIDKEVPIATVIPAETQYVVTEENGTVDITLTINAQDTGASGLDKMQYAWAKEGEEPIYIDFTNEVTIEKTNLKIGQYNLYIKVTDKAGNEADLKQIRYNIKLQDPVAQIGETKYLTIQDAVEACSKEVGEEITTIIMLKNTDEEFSTYEGQNIILDLKGYTIGSSNQEKAICTNNATLQIIDTSAEKTGKLESLNRTAIINNGILTIGDNSANIEPNIPTIYGKKQGVLNNNIFNFYDGKIQGITPIQGKVTSTPEGYGPVSTDYNNGITTVQLGVVSGYEARIEWVYYTTVQEAIDETRTNVDDKNRDTVTILKDIQVNEILTIIAAQNIIFDLDGYALTIVPEKDRIIENYGNIEIADSSEGQSGEITVSSRYAYTIYNKGVGKVKITGGTIRGSGSYSSYAIYNNSTGTIEVTGGMVVSNYNGGRYGYGIYNNSKGTVKVAEGTVRSEGDCSGGGSGQRYGIYNKGTGDVIITGGIVNAEAMGCGTFGIYNDNEGNVTVEGGNVNSSSSNGYGIYNKSTGKITVRDGIISSVGDTGYGSNWGIYNNDKGIIELIEGEVNSTGAKSYGIFNKSTGSLKVIGGAIRSTGRAIYGIYNNDAGNVTVLGGTIKSSYNYDPNLASETDWSCGIYNKSIGNVTVAKGTISSSSYNNNCCGIYNFGTGRLVIGIKEDDLVLQEEVNIKAEYTGTRSYTTGIGVYNSEGTLYFFDGRIEGNTSLLGIVTEAMYGYEIKKEETETTEYIYLKEEEHEEIVQIESVKYTSLQEAIDSIGENEEKTIEALKDFEIDEAIKVNKNVRLNLNGKEVTNRYYEIENTGKLIIEDLTENKEGKLNCINTINGITNKEEGNIEIISGTVSNNGKDSKGIFNKSTGSVTITEGTVSGDSYGIYNSNNGNVIVKAGIVNSNTYGIYNENEGSITVTGGAINSSNYGIRNKGTGTIEILGGTVSGSGFGIYNDSTGAIEVKEGTVNADSHGIWNNDIGIIKIKGGGVTCSNGYAIRNNSTGTIEITGGTITGEGGISNGTGSVMVTGGKIICSNNEYSSYGIYNGNTGSIIIGTKGDGLVSQEEPYIKGEYTGASTSYVGYGIYNKTGTLYFYDGKIEGTIKAVYDIITEWEENTELNYNESETILTLASELTDVAQIGEITYATLQEAIDAIEDEQTSIKILRNVTYSNTDSVIINPNTKNIIIDLNGYKITSSIPEKTIQNEGILEITDTSESQTGIIISTEQTTVNNIEGAKLKITGGTIENRTKQAIYNEGKLIIVGGTVNSSNSSESGSSYGIYNDNIGTIEVTGGKISSKTTSKSSSSYGIYNNSIVSVIINGGTVSSSNSSESGSSSSYGIYNNNIGTIEVTGGAVNSSGSRNRSYGIYNNDTGIIEITEGTVSSRGSSVNYGIYNNDIGIIKIGVKGDGLISQEKPYIEGNYTGTFSYAGYGIYNTNGTLNFYDGKIEGSAYAISGNITEIEELTELLITNNDSNNEIIQLEQKSTNAVSIDGTEYDSIQKAVQACGITENTIQLLRNVNSGTTIIIEENQNITIDLNGYTLNNYQEITNKGTLKITDTSAEQTGSIIGMSEIVIKNEGMMELLGGVITGTSYAIKNTGDLTLNGAIILDNIYGIYNTTRGTINMLDGTIKSNTYGIYNLGEYNSDLTTSIVNITGGYIKLNTYGIYNYRKESIVNITEGIIDLNEYGIYNCGGTTNITSTGITSNTYGIYNAGGTTNIKEGSQISSTTGIYNASGTINIGETGTMNANSPLIIGEEYGLVNNSTATVYMYDGQIKGKTGATQGFISYTETGYAVANKVDGEYYVDYLALAGTITTVAEVNGISFSNLQSAINCIIGEEAQTIKLTNGINSSQSYTIAEGQNIILDMNGKTITSDQEVTITNNGTLTIIDTSGINVAKISNTVGTAIINNGTLSLGENDGTVNQDLINIEGTTYGIENAGTLNFYDGTINGASAVNGTITTRADGYVIRTTTVDSKERYYLSA